MCYVVGSALALGTPGARAQSTGYEGSAPTTTLTSPALVRIPDAGQTAGSEKPARHSEFVPTLGLDETFTTNANYDRLRNEKKSDFVTQITPGFRIAEYGPHSSLVGTVALPLLLYARTGSENSRVLPDVSLTGGLASQDDRLALDGAVYSSRQFLTPFGARPTSPTVNTLNEYSSTSYVVRQSYHGDLPNGLHYDIHDANTWTNLQGEPGSLSDAYTNEASVLVMRDPVPLGGGFSYSHTRVTFTSDPSPPLTTSIGRAYVEYAPNQQLRLSFTGGYENNHYPGAAYDDATYGIGMRWRPSDRTAFDAAWEHRFFGSSWHVAFDHRTPLTVWSFHSSRDVSSYPQQIATFATGANINTLLNSLFSSRIPDPVARQQAIDNLVALYGLPANTSVPVSLYSQQARLVTDTRLQAGFTGVRNNVFATVYRNRNQQVVQTTEAAGLLLPFDDITQTGGNVVWSSRLSPTATLTGMLDYLHSTGTSQFGPARTDNASASLTVTVPISPRTDFHYGVRYQLTRSNESINVNGEEEAVYVGILHRFR